METLKIHYLQQIFVPINVFFVFSQNSRTAVRLKVLEMLASVISANSVLYRVSLTGVSSHFEAILFTIFTKSAFVWH